MMLGTSQPRGLHNFISDIRNATSKEDERARIDKELANIRQKFSSSSQLNSYQKKKYVWKMCYIHILGYDIDFGQLEYISLMTSSKYSEKAVGYMACSLLLRPEDEMMTMVLNSIRSDLVGSINFGQCLALSAVSNIGGKEMANALCADVNRLAVAPVDAIPTYSANHTTESTATNKGLVCKKAYLCLLRIFRLNAEVVDLPEWVRKFGKILEDRDIGVILSGMGLLVGLANYNPTPFEPLVPYVISVLTRLVVDKACPAEYLYYRTACPWLQVKCLRFLQLYRVPDKSHMALLNEVLTKIVDGTEATEIVNKANMDHAVLFEAISLLINYGPDGNSSLREQALSLTGRFVGIRDANVRYLALEAMTRLAKIDGASSVQSYQHTVLESLRDVDVSVRRRALDLMFVMTDENNAETVVDELITTLLTAESAIKEDIVVKIAILAEKFAKKWQWYLDSMCRVISLAGDYVAEAVWFRIVQVVQTNTSIHEYAAEKMFETVQDKYCNEISVSLGAYLLGELGQFICQKTGMNGFDQYAALHQHYGRVSPRVQAILLTTYVKLANVHGEVDGELRRNIMECFTKNSTSCQLEIQQRSCEYLQLLKGDKDLRIGVLDQMPPYSGEEANSLYALLNKVPKETKAPESRSDRAQSSASASASAPSSSAAVAPSTAPNVDLIDLVDTMSLDTSAVGIPPEVQSKLNTWLTNCLIAAPTTRTTLYEDEIIKVTVASDYRFHQGRLELICSNKTGATIENFKVQIPTVPHVAVKMQDPSSRISPLNDVTFQIMLACMRPFSDVLDFELTFSVGQAPYKYPLKLPCVANSFFEALQTDSETFMTRWKAITGEGSEVQEIFNSSRKLTSEFMSQLRSTYFAGLHLGGVSGLDKDNTATGSGSFRTGTVGADGNMIAVGALLRLEANFAQNCFRITVRAKHPLVAQAVKNTIKMILS